MSAFVQQDDSGKSNYAPSGLRKRQREKKSFSLIASVTLAVILWDSRPFSRMVSFPPWHPWISHITSYRARQAEAQLGSWHVFAHRHNTLHPTLPTPPAWFFMPLVVPQSAHAGKGGNHNGQFHCWRRNLCFRITPRETKGLFMVNGVIMWAKADKAQVCLENQILVCAATQIYCACWDSARGCK